MAGKAAPSDKLTPQNIEKVIELLKAEKPITKKAACEILGINYNTTRLDSIIDGYLKKREFEEEQRSKKRYKPASKEEIDLIIGSYLEGDPVSAISKRIYRSDNFVSNVLDKVGCPKREIPHSYFSPGIFPDSCISKEFKIGQKVYSSRYDSLATIKSMKMQGEDPVYCIWLEDEKWQQFAYQPWWELGSLEHLKPHCSSI
jgi:hypothetical protein